LEGELGGISGKIEDRVKRSDETVFERRG